MKCKSCGTVEIKDFKIDPKPCICCDGWLEDLAVHLANERADENLSDRTGNQCKRRIAIKSIKFSLALRKENVKIKQERVRK
ncbi:hypothetical protein LCGC14_3045900 [marine sediment metagenome]|uniref:Uncharacterized protein n=1 Tax=marine sediment metagenome TaxID=412755 RepID=A0A0F8ZE30_9ZZZZ